MVEQEDKAQAHQHKQVTLSYEKGTVLANDTKLHRQYSVWAMVKGQQNTPVSEDEKYISENQLVANFATVSINHI